MSQRGDGFFAAVAILGFIFVIAVLIVGIGFISAYEKTSAGEVAVVRNGGYFDNHKIRQVIPPASELTYAGLWSDVHKYPAQQRFYKISSNASESDSGQIDNVTTPTANGVNVGIEGTIYFTLTDDEELLKKFDDAYGTRKFDGKYPHEGDEGFSKWLNTILRPVIDNNLRKEIGSVTCADLVSSCALVQNEGNVKAISEGAGVQNQAKLEEIETAVNDGLVRDIQATLGENYLTNIRFSLVKVHLPTKVEQAVESAQAAFGDISKAQARLQQAKLDAEANRERQRGYVDCPACAIIDANKSIPKGITTWAPGKPFSVTP